MYAIIETGGKQLKVQAGQQIWVEKLDANEGDEVTFKDVILIGGDGETKVGTPTVANATVTGKVEKQGKEKKVVTYKYKPKKHSHTKTGHRQPYTRVMINAVNA
uniref:Large ribosomal subunit protein bL21 n=1 Tax=Loigolactobacillus rennini TaxID=238013 RepID=A0A1K2I771_9LACO|nr:LSU ribosomal protein L21p [Loigolactobacillus rennini]